MKTSEELRKNLRAIDHKSYPAYKSVIRSENTYWISNMYRETRLRPLPDWVWKLRTKTRAFRVLIMKRNGIRLLWKIICSAVFINRRINFVSRRKVPGKAESSLSADAGRRYWKERPAKLEQTVSSWDLKRDFRQTDARLMRRNSKKYYSSLFLYASNKAFNMRKRRNRNLKKLFFFQWTIII